MATGPRLRDVAGMPRYGVLAQTLLDLINAGSFPVGSLLPTETELCRQYGVSRTTVREAVRSISDMGLVVRKPGVGTLVRAKYTNPRYVHAIESVSDIFQYAKASGKPVLLGVTEVTASEAEAELLRCAPGRRWLKLETARYFAADGVPMAHVRAYVPPAYAGIARLVPLRGTPMYTLIEKEYGEEVVELLQEFKAVSITAHAARVLKVKPGSPGLYVIRHYFGSGERLLLVTLSVYPSDRFSYAMRLRSNRQAAAE
jgi:GntR family transcriptional regulator